LKKIKSQKIKSKRKVVKKLNRIVIAQECDATEDERVTLAGYIMTLFIMKNIQIKTKA